ncbi:hypothetical protein NBRC10513_002668 [Rhodotorula toruloides]
MSSSVGKSTRLGRPASLDTLPAELLKAVVILVARQDERLVGTKDMQPPRTRWPFEKGLVALSLTCKRLRAATLPFLCKKIVPRQLLQPVFQFGRIPQAMLDGIEELDCRDVTLETFAAAGKGLSALPNLTSLKIDYGKLCKIAAGLYSDYRFPPDRRFAPSPPPVHSTTPPSFSPMYPQFSPASPRYSPTSPQYSPSSPHHLPPCFSPRTPLYSSEWAPRPPYQPRYPSPLPTNAALGQPTRPAIDRLEFELAIDAFRPNRRRIRSLTLTDVDSGEFANWLNVFARRDILQHLTIGPSPNFLQLDQLRMLSCLSSYTIASLDLSDISLRSQGALDMDDLAALPTLQELEINVRAPNWLRLVERLAPNVVKLNLICTEMPLDARHAALRFPQLRELRFTGPASSLTLLAAFSGCKIATLVWIQQRASYWEMLQRTDFVEHLGDFPSLRIVSFGELNNLPPGEIESVKTACAHHGIEFAFETLDAGSRAPPSRMSTLNGLSSASDIAASLDGLVEWTSDRIDWLKRCGDVKGLREMVDLMSGVDAREMLERA